MNSFLSCDWGTSSFRLRLVKIPGIQFTSFEIANQGIGKTFELWKQKGAKDEERFSFYLSVIDHHIGMLERQLNFSLQNIPLIISGMASSSIGMMELPYKEVPLDADGSDLIVKKILLTNNFSHDILIISGVRTENDVVRGEETQLAGCVHDSHEEQVFLFPGTHSKHITVKNGHVADIKTYMTGEFFELLSKKSILSTSVSEGEGLQYANIRKSFEKGIRDSSQSNLLHNSFTIRTNQLFNRMTREENYHYLSGLLIGTELKDLLQQKYSSVTLVSAGALEEKYFLALCELGLNQNLHQINADEALINGQYIVYHNSLNKEFM